MNNLSKLGAAGVLAMGFVSAHAGVVGPTSSPGSTGDVFLFADVLSGGSVVQSFAADTGVSVDALLAGTAPSTLFSHDANFDKFIAFLNANPTDTVEWSVQGGGYHTGGDLAFVTTVSAGNLGLLTASSGQNLSAWETGLANQAVPALNTCAGTGKTCEGAAASTTTWDPTIIRPTAGTSNWYGQGPQTFVVGLGATNAATLYTATAPSFTSANPVGTSSPYTVTLTANGLTYSSAAPVPLPAAVWLLGSGLLGLAGVGRRKSVAAV